MPVLSAPALGDWGQFIRGGTAYPLPQVLTNEALKDADPAIYYALDFFASMINLYMGPRFLAELEAAGMTAQASYPVTNAVMQTNSFDPSRFLQSDQLKFPLLSVYRKKTKYGNRTTTWRMDESTVGVEYILPPMNAGQARRLWPFLSAVKDILDDRGDQGWDPAYTPPGSTLGAVVWQLAGIVGFEFRGEATFGFYPQGDSLSFPFFAAECWMPEKAFQVHTTLFAGADITSTIVAPDGTSPPVNVAVTHTQLPPVPTSVAPATGTIGGGTNVTITGTMFGGGGGVKSVTFGGLRASNVVYVNATTIACTTPLQVNPGAMTVVVANNDGQSGSVSGAYTYTTP